MYYPDSIVRLRVCALRLVWSRLVTHSDCSNAINNTVMPSYWSRFPDFEHNANTPIRKEFRRLAQLKGWVGSDPQQQKKYRREWGKCFLSEFTKHYGQDDSSLAGWQSLCGEVGLEEIPQSVKECRSVSFLMLLTSGGILYAKYWSRP